MIILSRIECFQRDHLRHDRFPENPATIERTNITFDYALQSFSEMIKLKYEGERVDFDLTGERVEFKSRDLFEVMTGSRLDQ